MPASYPQSLKSFTTVFDQPYTPPPGTPVDPSIDYAIWTSELNDEVVAIENMIGSQPFAIPPSVDIAGSISQLYQNTASLVHTHQHRDLTNLGADDHPILMATDGSRGFTTSQVGVAGGDSRDLATRDQVTNVSYINTATFNNQMNGWFSALGHQVRGVDPGNPLWNGQSFNGAYRIQGGVAVGYTDSNGYLYTPFNPPYLYQVQTVNWMRIKYPGASHFGYVFHYMEDQLVIKNVDRGGFRIQFLEDTAIDKRAWVAMTWIAIGI